MASSGSWKRSVTINPQVAVFDDITNVGVDPSFEISVTDTLVLEIHGVSDALQFSPGDATCPSFNQTSERSLRDESVNKRAVEGLCCTT